MSSAGDEFDKASAAPDQGAAAARAAAVVSDGDVEPSRSVPCSPYSAVTREEAHVSAPPART